MLNRRDIEATLRSLLMQFQSNIDLDLERVAHFAHAGAEALLMQTRMDTWLDAAARQIFWWRRSGGQHARVAVIALL